MKKTLFLSIVAIVLIALGLIYVNENKNISVIGGQKDGYGCSETTGYSYDEKIGACTRDWELDDSGKVKAATVAVASLSKITETYPFTVVDVEVLRCPGCYRVLLERDQKRFEVNISDWRVVEKGEDSGILDGFDEYADESGNDSGQNEDIDASEWRIYEDENAGFSLRYPENVSLDSEIGGEVLKIEAEKIDELEGTMGFDEITALLNQESLMGGEYGKDVDWPLKESRRVVDAGGVNAQSFMVLSRFEVCDTVFERKLYFFNNNYQIVITLSGPGEEIKSEEPSYFMEDLDNCGGEIVWQVDKQGEFFENLKKGEMGSSTQRWFDDFDSIVSTIVLSGSVNDLSLIEGFWVSEDDKDFAVEFSDSKKMDFYGGEKMSEGDYEIIDNNILSVSGSEGVIEYEISELSSSTLVLFYREVGVELRFKKE